MLIVMHSDGSGNNTGDAWGNFWRNYLAVQLKDMWLDLRKPGFHAQLQIFRNTKFNYLKCYNSGREADACMKFAMIL